MKPWIVLAVLLACAPCLSAQDAQNLLREVDAALVPPAYSAQMTMLTKKPAHRDLTMSLTVLYKKGVGSFMEVTAPARDKGTRFLQKSGTLWLYSPRSGSTRPIRLSPRQDFQGSVFSNKDVGEPQYSQDYTATRGGQETITLDDGTKVDAVILVGLPKTEKATYGKIRIWMRPSDQAPLKIEYWAKSGLLFKRMSFSNFQDRAGRSRPMTYRMESLDQPGAFTELTMATLEARPDLPDSTFSETQLTR